MPSYTQSVRCLIHFLTSNTCWRSGTICGILSPVHKRNMLLKTYNRTGIVTWSNSKANSHLLVCAPTPQTEQGPFLLEVIALDLAEKSKDLQVIGRSSYHSRFRCLAWDVFGEKDGTYQHGLLFAGAEDGGISIWDPYQIVSAQRSSVDEGSVGLVYSQDPIVDYPIICAQWNSLKPNLLGFGTTEVLIMDIGKGLSEGDPSIYKISQKNPHVGSYVTAVAWNKEVNYIMASASENGLIALWDVKVNKSIFSFKDNSHSTGNKNVNIAWSKSVFAQIAVTLDDENKNQLQIWDLRNQKGPIVVIDKNHTKGINCMDWCDSDPELILASSKDNKVICWNYTRQQPVSEMQMKEPIVDIKWSKKLPSIYYVSTQSNLEIYTMDDNNLYSYIPKWYKIPVGTDIGPMGRILSYDNKHPNVLTEYSPLNLKTQELRTSIDNVRNFFSLQVNSYLLGRKNSSQNQQGQFWSLMQLISSGGLQSDIYNYLGFNKDVILKSAEQYTGKKYDSHAKSASTKTAKTNNYIHLTSQDAENFFATMATDFGTENVDQSRDQQNVKYDMVPRNFDWDTGRQKIIKQNLLVGNYTAAIDAALKCGRTAEALVIAYSQGGQIFKSTLKTFFTETTDSFITGTLRYIADRELEDMVKKYQLSQWKECVAFIYSLVHDQRPQLLKALAQRLLHDGNLMNEAFICLALAEDFNELLNLFHNQMKELTSGTVHKIALLQLVEKLLIIRKMSTKQVEHSPLFDKLVLQGALVLYEEGECSLACELLSQSNVQNEKVASIRFLIAQSNAQTRNRYPNPIKPINIPVMLRKTKKADHKGDTQTRPANKTGHTRPDNSVKQPPARPVGVSRPAPVAPSPVISQSFDPNQQQQHTPSRPTGFNPHQNLAPTSVNYNQTPQPKKPIFRPPPPRPLDAPTNQVPQESSNTNYNPSSFNPSSFNPTVMSNPSYNPENTTNPNINVPSDKIPSASSRNRPPPPPPPTKIKRLESNQGATYQQEHSTSFVQRQPQAFQSNPPSRTNSMTHPPPPLMKKPEERQTFDQPSYVSNPQQNIPQSQVFTQQPPARNPVVAPVKKAVPPPPRRG